MIYCFVYNNFIINKIYIVHLLSVLPSELLSIIEFLFYTSSILFLFRYFGKVGLIVFSVLSIILGNIQVLKIAQYNFQAAPVALGTIIFGCTFLASDLLTEHYGVKIARNNIILGFIAQLFVVITMLFTLGYKPLEPEAHEAIHTIFIPSFRFLIASLGAFSVSQFFDVYIYEKIRAKSDALWLRSNVSTIISSFIDSTVFSLLAWYFLNPTPLPLLEIFYTYILGTYWFRVLISLCSTPVMYLSYRIRKDENPSGFLSSNRS